ncbi:MAG: hypothetical protein QG608_2289 [Actinomycetota bacterium]|nr:hypothetical protein [Actinomycetota bacterium]
MKDRTRESFENYPGGDPVMPDTRSPGIVPFFAAHHRLPTIGGNLPPAQEALNSLHDLFGSVGGREEKDRFRPSRVPGRPRPADTVGGPGPRRFPLRMNPAPRTDLLPSPAGGGGPPPPRRAGQPHYANPFDRSRVSDGAATGSTNDGPRAGGSIVSAPGNRTASPHNQRQASSHRDRQDPDPGRVPLGHGGRRSGQEWDQPQRSDRLRWSNR